MMQQGERYEFSYYTQRDLFYGESSEDTYNKQKTQGHVVLITRNENNDIVWYDPQKRDVYITNEESKMYINSWVDAKEMAKDVMPRTIRIDNKQINPYYEGVLVH